MIKKSFDEEKLAKLWVEYKSNPSPTLRALLAEAYSPIVRKQVSGFVHKKPNVLDYDDLYQAGNLGLLDAIEKFDPSRGNLFQTYATIRVRGAILDEINSMDWTPRSVRENIKGVIKSIETHYETSQEEPTVEDIAKISQLNKSEAREILGQMNRTYMVHAEHETMDLIGPTTDVRQDELQRAISYVMDSALNEDEKIFIHLRYFMGYSNKEIMSIMHIGVTSMRSIKESATAKLIEGLQGYEDF